MLARIQTRTTPFTTDIAGIITLREP